MKVINSLPIFFRIMIYGGLLLKQENLQKAVQEKVDTKQISLTNETKAVPARDLRKRRTVDVDDDYNGVFLDESGIKLNRKMRVRGGSGSRRSTSTHYSTSTHNSRNLQFTKKDYLKAAILASFGYIINYRVNIQKGMYLNKHKKINPEEFGAFRKLLQVKLGKRGNAKIRKLTWNAVLHSHIMNHEKQVLRITNQMTSMVMKEKIDPKKFKTEFDKAKQYVKSQKPLQGKVFTYDNMARMLGQYIERYHHVYIAAHKDLMMDILKNTQANMPFLANEIIKNKLMY